MKNIIYFQSELTIMFCIIDTETTGLPQQPRPFTYYNPEIYKYYDTSRVVSICYALYKPDGTLISYNYDIVKPYDFKIDNESKATEIHGITHEKSIKEGKSIHRIISKFIQDIKGVNTIVGHNLEFDLRVFLAEMCRYNKSGRYNDGIRSFVNKEQYCTMRNGKDITRINSKYYNGYKNPKLIELYKHFFKDTTFNEHNAFDDVKACADCYLKMKNLQLGKRVII